jgi:hypothetical protein
VYRNRRRHDPSDLATARAIADSDDPIPVGLLYCNPNAICYEDVHRPAELRTPASVGAALNSALDAFTVWPVTERA